MNCTVTILLFLLLARKFMLALLFLFILFSRSFYWSIWNFKFFWICTEVNFLFLHKETFIIPADFCLTSLSISHLIKAMCLFYFLFLFIYLFIYIFIYSLKLQFYYSSITWIFNSLAYLPIPIYKSLIYFMYLIITSFIILVLQ